MVKAPFHSRATPTSTMPGIPIPQSHLHPSLTMPHIDYDCMTVIAHSSVWKVDVGVPMYFLLLFSTLLYILCTWRSVLPDSFDALLFKNIRIPQLIKLLLFDKTIGTDFEALLCNIIGFLE